MIGRTFIVIRRKVDILLKFDKWLTIHGQAMNSRVLIENRLMTEISRYNDGWSKKHFLPINDRSYIRNR